jgi:hypothetical protein
MVCPFAGGVFDVLSNRNLGRCRIEIMPRAELFLPPGTGAGLFSIQCRLIDAESCSLQVVRDLTYELVQHQPRKGSLVQRRRSESNPGDNLDAEKARLFRKQYFDSREFEQPVANRLDSGRFTISELYRYLVADVLKATEGTPRQGALQVFSAVRLAKGPEEVEEAAAFRARVIGLACSLAQAEESTHSLAVSRESTVPTLLLSDSHFAATCIQGSAHVLIDQGLDFDRQRVDRCTHQYFVDFLAATQLRSTLQAIGERTWKYARLKEPKARDVRDLQMECTVMLTRADLHHVSEREAHNRFYRHCLDALGVPTQISVLKEAVSDFEKGLSARRQLRTAVASKHIQNKVEWIEVFLISVYAFEVAEALGKELHFSHGYVGYGSLLVLILSLGLASAWVHGKGGSWRLKLGIAVGILFCYWAAGVSWFASHGGDSVELAALRKRAEISRPLQLRLVEIESRKTTPSVEDLRRFRDDLKVAEAAQDLREQAMLLCGEECMRSDSFLRSKNVLALRYWQHGDHAAAAVLWKEIVASRTAGPEFKVPPSGGTQ